MGNPLIRDRNGHNSMSAPQLGLAVSYQFIIFYYLCLNAISGFTKTSIYLSWSNNPS